MPELPEVETTRRGIEPYFKNQKIIKVEIRHYQLRWPIDRALPKKIRQQTINDITRRGKYLLLHTAKGVLIIHLGMSGSLRVLKNLSPPNKHDHVDIIVSNGACLRFNDPRRFGCVLWVEKNPYQHALLKNLGPEPLTDKFDGNYLFEVSRKRKVPLKTFIMNAEIVVGVGNIYANEALFLAGIHPKKSAGNVSIEEYQQLAKMIKRVLNSAIKKGGTTLRNFSGGDGKPGYFKQQLNVYGRGGLPCVKCKTILKEIRLNQRATVFCASCQSYA